MFVIRKITDPRLSRRICENYGQDGEACFAYGAFQKDAVLATAVFCCSADGHVRLLGVDTGRKADTGLVDGLCRAAFSQLYRQGAAQYGELDKALPQELRRSMTKFGYPEVGRFELGAFFAKKHCGQ